MDRFRWCSDSIEHRTQVSQSTGLGEESIVTRQPGVRLYDGPERTSFDGGFAILTTHRLIWQKHSNPSSGTSRDVFLALPLVAILSVRTDSSTGLLRGTRKLVLRLISTTALHNTVASWVHPLPWLERWSGGSTGVHAVVAHSSENHIKLGFTRGGEKEFLVAIEQLLEAKLWTAQLDDRVTDTDEAGPRTRIYGGGGIGAIEREQAARAGAIDVRLEDAFDDLDKLMQQATEIVQISHTLASQARETKDGPLSMDETAQLRAAMLSMGIDPTESEQAANPVPNGASFHAQLAHEISRLLTPLLTQRQTAKTGDSPNSIGAGCIDLASAYCRVNRARGMELISPDDLLRACGLLESERLPLRLKSFPSGLLILHLASENEVDVIQSTAELVRKRGNLTADELARTAGVSNLLAQERLLAAERVALVCRDDSEAGLLFYPNRFLGGT